MLSDKLRDGANSKGFKFLLGIIIVSFVLTGVGGYLIPRLNTDPVTIGDYKVTANEWTEQYNRQAQQLHRMPNGSELLENPAYVAEMKKQVLERMINNVAFNSTVWDMNVRIGDDQVRDVIRNTPAFQKDGKFDNELYVSSVRNMGMSPDYFGEQLRISLMSESVSTPLLNVSAMPMPYELSAIAKIFLQSRVVDLYTVDTQAIAKDITVTDDEAQAYYDAHHKEFMAPANVRFNYLLLSAKDLAKDVEVTDAKLEEFYNMYAEDFAIAESREIAHLLVRADNAKVADNVAKIEEGLKKGTPFEKLASQYSDDNATKDKGGVMGTYTQGQLAADLDAAAFSLAEGEVSPAISDSTGVHFIKVVKVNEAHTPALADVKSKVTEAYVAAQVRDLYNQRVTTMSDLSFENPDSLDVTAEALKLEVQDSGLLNKGDVKAQWPLNTNALQAIAFNEDVYSSGVNSSVITLDEENTMVINVTEHHDATLRPFADVKEDALAKVRDDKINGLALSTLQDVAKAVAQNDNPTLPANVKVKKDVAINSGSDRVSAEMANAIYALPQDVKAANVIEKNGGFETLAVLKKVELANADDLPAFERVLYPQLAQYLSLNSQAALYRQARSLSKIEYNQEAIDLVTQQNAAE